MGIAKGKKNYDKRESIKQRDVNRELKKQYKNLKTNKAKTKPEGKKLYSIDVLTRKK